MAQLVTRNVKKDNNNMRIFWFGNEIPEILLPYSIEIQYIFCKVFGYIAPHYIACLYLGFKSVCAGEMTVVSKIS